MKIIQVNVQYGFLLSPLVELINKERPDIVCTQEIVESALPIGLSENYQTLSQIKQQTGYPYTFLAPTYGADAFNTHLEFGNAVFSKWPIENQQTIPITGDYIPTQTARDFDYNIRNLQTCSLDINGKKLSVANHQGYLAGAHSRGDDTSVAAMQKVAKSLAALPHPLIFCGDLNVAPNTTTVSVLDSLDLRNLTAENNIRTTLSKIHRAPEKDRSSVPCDYIFVSDDVQVQNFRLADEVVSDHKALVLEFDV